MATLSQRRIQYNFPTTSPIPTATFKHGRTADWLGVITFVVQEDKVTHCTRTRNHWLVIVDNIAFLDWARMCLNVVYHVRDSRFGWLTHIHVELIVRTRI